MRDHNYFIYIVTNKNKTVLYIGVTNDLQRRVYEHEQGLISEFTKKYNCHYLIYYEYFQDINDAIEREKVVSYPVPRARGVCRKALLFLLCSLRSQSILLSIQP